MSLSERLTPLTVALSAEAYTDSKGNIIVTLTMAAVVLYMIPMILVFFVAQRYIIEGVVTTGLKG